MCSRARLRQMRHNAACCAPPEGLTRSDRMRNPLGSSPGRRPTVGISGASSGSSTRTNLAEPSCCTTIRPWVCRRQADVGAADPWPTAESEMAAEPGVERSAIGANAPDVLLDRRVGLQVFAGWPARAGARSRGLPRSLWAASRRSVTSPAPAMSGWIQASITQTAVAASGISGRRAIPEGEVPAGLGKVLVRPGCPCLAPPKWVEWS